MPVRLLLTTAVLALFVTASAAAHEPGEKSLPGYESKVTSILPSLPGLRATVVEGDDKLELVNGTGKTLIVFGYNHEPYLRFTRNGVYENQNSPATFLNQDRFGKTKVPSDASAKAAPEWLLVAKGTAFQWHDHRIHWMSPNPPPAVQAHKGEPTHVFDWKVEASAGGRPVAIAGTLDYSPPGDGGLSTGLKALIGVGGAALLTAVAAALLRLRRRTRTSSFE